MSDLNKIYAAAIRHCNMRGLPWMPEAVMYVNTTKKWVQEAEDAVSVRESVETQDVARIYNSWNN